jgi:DNA polymerase III epsilon subunit-like protein
MTPVHHRNLVFLDVKTTGARPSFHEIVDIAIVPYDGAPFHTRLAPIYPERITDETIAVDGYDPVEWEGAPKIPEMYAEITTRLHDRVVCGHRIELDLAFVKSWCGVGTFDCYGIDTVTLAYAHLVPLGLSSLGLGSIASFLGLKPRLRHRAIDDALTCLDVYREILRLVRQRPQITKRRDLSGLSRDKLEAMIHDMDIAVEEARRVISDLHRSSP